MTFIKGQVAWNKGIHKRLNTGKTHFKKGFKPWNKGFVGYSFDDNKIKTKKCEVCGKTFTKPYGFNIGRWGKVRFCSMKCFGLAKRGENAPAWRGGIAFLPYGFEFNKELKEKIRERDGYRCQECFRHQDELYTEKGKKYRLVIHHLNYDKKDNQENNLISLCRSCHSQTNFKRNDWIKYFNSKI